MKFIFWLHETSEQENTASLESELKSGFTVRVFEAGLGGILGIGRFFGAAMN